MKAKMKNKTLYFVLGALICAFSFFALPIPRPVVKADSVDTLELNIYSNGGYYSGISDNNVLTLFNWLKSLTPGDRVYCTMSYNVGTSAVAGFSYRVDNVGYNLTGYLSGQGVYDNYLNYEAVQAVILNNGGQFLVYWGQPFSSDYYYMNIVLTRESDTTVIVDYYRSFGSAFVGGLKDMSRLFWYDNHFTYLGVSLLVLLSVGFAVSFVYFIFRVAHRGE